MSDDQATTLVTDLELAERAFFDQHLLKSEYFTRHREAFVDVRHTVFLNPHRNYRRLLRLLEAIYHYNTNHARRYARRLSAQAADWKNCEAVFAEIIVYYNLLGLIREGHVRALELTEEECDLIVNRADGTTAYLEVFSVMPDFGPGPDGVTDIRTHTEEAMASVRQKLLCKITVQKQFTAARENWAVIELNNVRIAGQFTGLSSLSDGYKVTIDTNTMQIVDEGYDWLRSAFDLPETQFLRGVVSFDLGNYADRGVLLNPKYSL